MKTSFVAFLNKQGIACASDTDMTLYALSRQEPVALAVNSYSPIPWDFIIYSYLRKGEIQIHETFSDYARDFANYVSIRKFQRSGKNLRATERDQWLKALRDYDLQDMARLAEDLIAMTSFERHMTFSPEGVGGPIDLAVITKNEGFIWLNCKSWHHHKDVGGRYGKFGV